MKKIYVFIQSGKGTDWVHGMAISEDGVVLAEHISSSHGWFLHDMGIESDWKHELYKAHYPEGYELILVNDPKNDPELKAAVEKNYLAQKAKAEVQ